MISKCSSVNRNNWEIIVDGEKKFAQLSKKYYKDNFPVVGDNVEVSEDEWGNYYIDDVCQRKNLLSRFNNGSNQNIASNIDIVFVVSSMNNEFNLAKLERFAIIGNIKDARLCFVLTKSDLCDNHEEFINKAKERFPSFPVIATSSVNRNGLDLVMDYWEEKESAIFIGSSGVGKSTIINALAEEELMKIGEIREKDAKGKHTTTSRNLFFIKGERVVIDTPGVRAVGVSSNFKEGVEEIFSEIVELEKSCLYRDCTHTHEKNCAVKNAVESGILSEDILKRYMKFKFKEKSRKEIMQEDNELLTDWEKERLTKNRKKHGRGRKK